MVEMLKIKYNKIKICLKLNKRISGLYPNAMVILRCPQAIDYYLRAMRSLANREYHPAVWDSVNWELSTTYFTLATHLQDYAPLSRKAQEQVVIIF